MHSSDMSDIQRGWDFAANLVGSDNSAKVGSTYVSDVVKAIEQIEDNINNHPYRGQDIAHLKGYIAEEWHAGTFNVDAVASGSADRATVLHSNAAGSVDIQLDSGECYSSKVYSDGVQSARAQAKVAPESGKAAYPGQNRLITQDQMNDAKAEAHRQAMRNEPIRSNVAEAYSETERKLTDRVESKEGVSSLARNRADFEHMAKDAKGQNFDASEHEVTIDSVISTKYMLRQATRAGFTAAAITLVMQMAPEIYKAIDYLVKNGEIDVQQIKRSGMKSISAGAEGFLRGSVACTVQIMCAEGLLGEGLKAVDPSIVGAIVAVVMGTIKNSILVAAGKMTPSQMGSELRDSLVVTSGFLIGLKIGDLIRRALGIKLSIFGYLLGTLIGCAFAVVYKIGKKEFISFCADTGFTYFGLVEQNYEIPDELMQEIGIDILPVPRTQVTRTEIMRANVAFSVEHVHYETIDITVLRRGVIGLNRIGYVM